jgi:4-hydroxy-2-oxoheptanedioate aldolase
VRENIVLKKLKNGKVTIGSWVCLNSSIGAAIMAKSGWDWLVIDAEHGVIDYRDMVEAIQAILATQTVPIIRVAWNDPALIKRALDAGAMGILVPMVMSAEEAKRAVEAVRFPPEGKRSVVGVAAEVLHGENYLERANQEILLAVQIEHIDAAERADEICRVDGVDVVFVGPYDLAQGAGKPAGIHAQSVEEAETYFRQGFRFLAVGSDVQFLRLAINSILSDLKVRW